MYKLSRIFMMLTAVLCAFILLGSTLAAAAGGTEMETAVSTSTWDTQFSSPPTGNGVDGEVIAMVEDGNGNLYVGGAFDQVGSTTAHNIAMWDGSSWHALVDGNGYNGVSGGVWSLAIDPASGDVYAGGVFARIDGNNAGPLACRIARWSPSANTWSTLTDSSGFFGTDGTVHALAVVGNELFVGGSFDGVATSGSCGTLNVAASGIASWNISNSSWSDVNGSMGSLFPKVNALTTDGSNLYAGGWFDMAGTASAANVAKWNGSNWSALSSGLNNEVKALTWDNGTLYAGGAFDETGSGSSANYIARWNGTNWAGLGSGMGGICTPIVYAILAQGNDVHAGGHFQNAGGIAANNIAHWDETAQAWTAMGGGLGIEPVVPCEAVDYVNSLAADVIAGGTFVTAGGVDSYHVARWQTISYGVSLSPETAVSAGEPGETVTYTLQVKNTGSQADTFMLTVEGANFPTQLSKSSVGPLAANGSEAIAVTVNIPGSAGEEDSDAATIVAMSQGDPDVQASSQLTTNIAIPTELTLTKNDGGITVGPSATIPYTLTYNNVGSKTATDVTLNETVPPHTTFNAAASSAGWSCADNSPAGTACQYAVGSIGAGNGGSVTFAVTLASDITVRMIKNTAILTDSSGVHIPATANTPVRPFGIITGQKFYDSDGNGTPFFSRDYFTDDPLIRGGLGDINSDGHMDMAVASKTNINLFFGRGDGSFSAPVVYPFYNDHFVMDIGIADLNHDGWQDMVVLLNKTREGIPYKALILLGQGGGIFVEDHEEFLYNQPDRLLLTDLNNDTTPDIIITYAENNRRLGDMSAWLGKGDGTFTHQNLRPLNPVSDIDIADQDGDGDLDIVTAHHNNGFTVWDNDGNGQLTETTYAWQSKESRHVAWGDVDNDGDLDVVYDGGLEVVSVLNNSGVFTGTPISTAIPTNTLALALTDTNGDTNLDLLLTYAQTVTIRLGNGSGTFSPTATVTLPVGTEPQSLFLYDLDNDGHEDILTINQASKSVSRYFGDGVGGYSFNRMDSGLPNWTIYIDENGNNQLDASERFSITNASGSYTFSQLITGTYEVREVLQPGWVQTSPTTPLTIANGLILNNFIGNYELNVISGTVYDDQNQNRVRDVGEPAQVGWDVFIDDNDNQNVDDGEIFTTTNSLGQYFFPDLPAKTYFLRISLNGGWKATTPHNVILPANSGQTHIVDVGTTPLSIIGQKFDDSDGTGRSSTYFNSDDNQSNTNDIQAAAAAGDLNGDENQDIINLVGDENIRLDTRLGRGDGTFMPRQSQIFATQPISLSVLSLVVGDINNDYLDDVIVTVRNPPGTSTPSVYIFSSKGDGTFEKIGTITLPNPIPDPYQKLSGIVLGDFNQDAYSDLAITYGSNQPPGSLFIYLNDGTGNFKLGQTKTTQADDTLFASDMDQDGNLDLVSSAQNGTVWINNGQAQFTAHTLDRSIFLYSSPDIVNIADIDGINGLDIVYKLARNINGNSPYYITLNSGNGITFSAPLSITIPTDYVEDIVAADVNNDGNVDLASVDRDDAMLVFLGNGDGTFLPVKRLDLARVASLLVPDDFNNDGNLDYYLMERISRIGYVVLNDGTGQFARRVEPGLPDWTIFLDNNSNDILDSGDISTTTDVNGYYTFTVPLSFYRVREVNQQDWVQTSRNPVVKPYNKDVLDVDFGNFKLGTITGTNFHDQNANLRLDAGEPGLSDWTIFLDQNRNGQLDTEEISTTTNVSGNYTFTNLEPDLYYLRVVTQPGWATSHPIPQIISPASGKTLWTQLGHYQTALVGDKVWLDSSIEGIQDNGEIGIGGVTTTLHLSTGTIVQTTTTNATGAYSFTVRPGRYYISFTLPSLYQFSPQNQGVFDFNDSDANTSTGETAVFTITSGVDQLDWDAGMFRLAHVGDRVWNDANYNGIQDNVETGVGGVTVTLYLSGTTTALSSAVTNSNGEYNFTVTPGAYWLKVARPSGSIFTHQDVAAEDLDSDVDGGGNSPPFVLGENEHDFNWDAGVVALATVGNLVWLDVDADGIRGTEDLGVPGITVTLRNGTGIVDTEITDGDGIYTFTQVIPGNYYIHIAKPTGWAYSPKQNPAAPDTDHDSDVDQTSGETDYMTLNPGQIDLTQDGGMYPLPATIGDRVWHDQDGNGIQDAGEVGMAGATVDLYLVGNTFPIATQTTDANGFYTFTNVLPNDYVLSFSPPNGYHLSPQDSGNDDALDSDANPNTSDPDYAKTASFTVSAGDVLTEWDAGVTRVGAITQNIHEDVWIVFDLLTTSGGSERVYLSGRSVETLFFEGVEGVVSDGDNNGREELLTRLDTLTVTGTSSIGAINLQLHPIFLSHGLMEERVNTTPDLLDILPYAPSGKADSFFHVYFTIEMNGLTYSHLPFHRWEGVIENIPPTAGNHLVGTHGITLFAPNNSQGITVQNLHYVYGDFAEIGGVSYNDVNGNGTRDAGESGLSNWPVSVDAFPHSATTLADGSYRLGIPLSGTYTVRQTPQLGWIPASPISTPVTITNSVTPTADFGFLHYNDVVSLFPAINNTLAFTNTQGDKTHIQFVSGTVNKKTTFYLTELKGVSASSANLLSNTPVLANETIAIDHAFRLDEESDGGYPPNLTLAKQAMVTIEYSDADVVGVDENSLRLFIWDWENRLWLDAEDGCETAVTPQLNTETNTFTTEICQTGRYALFGVPQVEFTVYLPVIMRP